MLVLSGKEVATKVRSEVQQECTRFKQETGHTPCLAVVLVGDDPASATYVASKGKACEEMGFDHRDYRLPADTTEDYVVNLVEQLNADPLVDGHRVGVAGAPGEGAAAAGIDGQRVCGELRRWRCRLDRHRDAAGC